MGLRLPLVYNTSSYDSVATLRELGGIISIYLADLRYASNEMGRKYSRVRHYADVSRAAIKEMYRQVGDLEVDDEGIAVKGLIIRHLVLPNGIAGSEDSLTWLVDETSPQIAVSIMSQYHPMYRAYKYKELNRRISSEEYAAVVRLVEKLGMENGWLQGIESARYYLPDFADDEPFSEG
jgi:putative pyruvate formate lyase activating enzyme